MMMYLEIALNRLCITSTSRSSPNLKFVPGVDRLRFVGFLGLFLFSLAIPVDSWADHVWVDSIAITGNRKTKDALILRELDFSYGDSIRIANLTDRLAANEKLLMNTGLFNLVKINIGQWNTDLQRIALEVEVVESWYIFPIPIFTLADRNFNQWWTEHKRSLSRVNYGLRFVYVNFTGNKDNLKLTLQGGYTRRVLLQYERPYVNRQKTLGITGRYFFDHRREYVYQTRFNRQQFFPNTDQINFKTNKAIISLHYRPRVQSFHELFMKFEDTRVSDDILDLNQDFFNGKTRLKFFELSYLYTRERRDSRFYALKGNYLEAQIQKEGIGIFDGLNKLNTSLLYAHYFPISRKINLEMRAKVKREWTRNQHPYYGLQALGFGEDFIRGYELYIIDGTDFVLSKNSLRFLLLDHTFDLKRLMPLQTYRIFPVMVWLTANTDLGAANNYLYNQDNPFNNRLLTGFGLGLDIILYQKYVFQVEYSINHLNEKGLFLHIRSDL